MAAFLVAAYSLSIITLVHARAGGCYKPVDAQIAPAEVIISARPSVQNIPQDWDWRNVGGMSLVSNVLTQQSPHVCGSCWAEAAAGAFSDRFKIATRGRLQVNLAVQVLLNFDKSLSGGSCFGGDDYVAASYFYKYGISDDTCAPFSGTDFEWGFECCSGENTSRTWVQQHMCHMCDWDGTCRFVKDYRLYRASEYGRVQGESAMMAEIYTRGPIACNIDSEPDAFDQYKTGIITSGMLPKASNVTDHVIVLAGFGTDAKTKTKFWVGRNSYGTTWGEGASGGWFRLERGNLLGIENKPCSFAVPHPDDVQRIMQEYAPDNVGPIIVM